LKGIDHNRYVTQIVE